MPLIRESLAQGRPVRLHPNGTSMLPMLRQGEDSVVLSPVQQPLRRFDIPLYQRENGQYVLHRIVKVEGSTYTCMGDNQFEPEEGIEHDRVIGVVTAFYRGQTRISVQSRRYGAYCRLWHYTRPLRRLWRLIK